MSERSKRGLKPSVLGLEPREVPTVISPLAFHGQGAPIAHAAVSGPQQNSAIAAAAEASAYFASHGGDPTATSATLALLTPQGAARSVFVQGFAGSYGVGAPLFVTQSKQFLLIGDGGGNEMLHTRPDIMRIYTPATPDGPVTGAVQINDKSVASSGNLITLSLQSTAAGLDRFGRPTHLIWQVTGGGGSYTGAIGQGTVDIVYHPGRGGRGKSAVGSHSTLFKGLVIQTGVSSIIAFDLNRL